MNSPGDDAAFEMVFFHDPADTRVIQIQRIPEAAAVIGLGKSADSILNMASIIVKIVDTQSYNRL